MTKKLLLLIAITLSSSLYSDTTTLKNGKVYYNAKVFHKGDTVTVSFECGKQIGLLHKKWTLKLGCLFILYSKIDWACKA
ncbi:MAG: hypothetical protein KBF93_23420 [Leptospiraceae bacterium]|nr:hypothetical protein [Leptospiraceae bacterium]